MLQAWSHTCPLPVVLLLDEIDALRDQALIAVLRQLRSIYPNRPRAAPSTVALIGLRDVRDYKVATDGQSHLGSASPFNVKVASLTLHGFSRAEIAALYSQHTTETRQAFSDAAIDRVSALTCGQPWLVNALAREVVEVMKLTGEIDEAHIEVAQERLILSRSTHLDSLADKLNEDRVRAVIEPILSGEELPFAVPERDIEYCVDLGLLAPDDRPLRIANAIYAEVLLRELTSQTQLRIAPAQRRWALADGCLDWDGVLAAFIAFWRQHGEWMVKGQTWTEAAHQIVLMAFLQRLVNGGAVIEREYALGTRRLDLLVRWHIDVDASGVPRAEDRHALELKVWRHGRADPLSEGLTQLDAYLARLGLATGTLVIFDARDGAAAGDDWATRGVLADAVTPAGRVVGLLRA